MEEVSTKPGSVIFLFRNEVHSLEALAAAVVEVEMVENSFALVVVVIDIHVMRSTQVLLDKIPVALDDMNFFCGSTIVDEVEKQLVEIINWYGAQFVDDLLLTVVPNVPLWVAIHVDCTGRVLEYI